MKIYLFVISIIISPLLAINYVYPEIINNNIVNNSIINKTLSYRMEPFLLINGTDYKDIPHNNTLTLQNFTIASWIKTNQSILSEPAHVINKGGFNTDEKGANMNYGIWFSTNGTIQGGFETESGEDFEVTSKKPYNDGKWHFVLLSYNGTLLRLYIDGNEISYKESEGAIPDSTGDQPLRIGANSLEEDKFFTGSIDEVRIWDRGLTNNEIKDIYKENTNRIHFKDGLILYHNFGINKNESLSKETTENPKQILKLQYKKILNLSNNTNLTKNFLSDSNIINKENTSKILSTIANNKTKNHTAINTSIEQSTNNNNSNNNFVFVVTGDWDCNKNTENTVNNIKSKSPDLVVSTGDMSYGDSGDCFYKVVNPIISKLKISLGNHDTPEDGSASLQNEYESYFKLKKPFYSFDYKNTHFIMMDSTHETSITSSDQQYQFVKQDLEKTSKNSNINWIIVTLHEPFYTNPGKHPPDQGVAKVYHPLFDKYGVDLVLAGHNHWYERTLPLKFNDNAPASPIVEPEDETEGEERISGNDDQIINFETLGDTATINKFDDSDNPTFITIGTAGRKQHDQSGRLPYITSVWDNGFGFLKIEVTKKALFGEFYANEAADKTGKKIIEPNYLIRDKFAISKQ
jgi:hypothetical protein